MITEHQCRQTGKVIVVTMGVKDALYLIYTDPQSNQAVGDVGPGIDQIDFPLIDYDAGHARAVDVPAIPLSRMNHTKIFPFDIVEAKRVRSRVALGNGDIQIYRGGFSLIGNGKLIDVVTSD